MKKMFLIALLMIALIPLGTVRADEKVLESYSATLANMNGMGKGPVPIKILVYGYTSEDEVAKLLDVLQNQGQDALEKAIFDVQKGRIFPVGRLGNDLNYIREIKTDQGRILRMVSSRPISFMELRYNGRSTDYPFGVLELRIANDGTIEGTIIGAAKIQIKDGTLDVESYGTQPLRLMNVKKTDQ